MYIYCNIFLEKISNVRKSSFFPCLWSLFMIKMLPHCVKWTSQDNHMILSALGSLKLIELYMYIINKKSHDSSCADCSTQKCHVIYFFISRWMGIPGSTAGWRNSIAGRKNRNQKFQERHVQSWTATHWISW